MLKHNTLIMSESLDDNNKTLHDDIYKLQTLSLKHCFDCTLSWVKF